LSAGARQLSDQIKSFRLGWKGRAAARNAKKSIIEEIEVLRVVPKLQPVNLL
jgi:hypothetical protein